MHFHVEKTTTDKLQATLDDLCVGHNVPDSDILDVQPQYVGGRDWVVIATHTEHRAATDPEFSFHREHDGSLSLESAVFQALGAASTCWENMSGTGVFQDRQAKAIGDALVAEIRSCPWSLPGAGEPLAG